MFLGRKKEKEVPPTQVPFKSGILKLIRDYEEKYYPRISESWKELVDIFRADIKNHFWPCRPTFTEGKAFREFVRERGLVIREAKEDEMEYVQRHLKTFWAPEFLNTVFGDTDLINTYPDITIRKMFEERNKFNRRYLLDLRNFYDTDVSKRRHNNGDIYHYMTYLEDTITKILQGKVMQANDFHLAKGFGLLAWVTKVEFNEGTEARLRGTDFYHKFQSYIKGNIKPGDIIFIGTDTHIMNNTLGFPIMPGKNRAGYMPPGNGKDYYGQFPITGTMDRDLIYYSSMTDQMLLNGFWGLAHDLAKIRFELVGENQLMVAEGSSGRIYFNPTPFGYIIWPTKVLGLKRVKEITRLYSRQM